VGPEDVKALAPVALPHRLSVRGAASGTTGEAVIREVLDAVSPPV
jgi:MoxR-like ATPase